MLTFVSKRGGIGPLSLVMPAQRYFAKPGQEPTKIPDKRGRTMIEQMIDDG